MTDRALEPPSANPFDQLDPSENEINYKPAAPKPANDNPFDTQDFKLAPASTALGAAARGAERSVLPALGSFPAIGAGAELGFTFGGAVGGPFAPVTAPAGALIGGVAAGFGASALIAKAQDYALSKLPDSWREAIGMDDRQEQLDQGEHPVASFLGGLAPYAMTMRPGAVARQALPENATTMQRIMANPVTARVFGGAAMGGMELGQEVGEGQSPDWTKVAISTGFGVVFNKPTRIGESLIETGAKPARFVLGRAEPTVAQAGDAKVAGPGITEDVFQGAHKQEPTAELVAQEAARTEQSVIGEPSPGPDVHDVARRLAPETFQNYDELVTRRDEFRKWIDEFNEPPQERFNELDEQRDALQRQLDDHLAARGGYTGGPEARRLRAQLRDTQNERDALTQRAEAFKTGQAEETADLAAARKHLLDTEFALRDLQPEVQAAYRRAADAIGAGTIEPEAVRPAEAEQGATAPPAGQEASPAAVAPVTQQEAGAAPTKSIEAQKAFIAQDVTRQLIAAGRPAEEAQAAGHLIAARYEARAARLKGAAGTAEELYRKEGAEIRGQGGPAAAPAVAPQPTISPEGKMTAQDLAELLRTGGKVEAGGKVNWREAPLVPAAPAEALAEQFKPGPAPKEPEPVAEAAPKQRARGGPRARDQQTWSLLEFLVSRGGIKPEEANISDLRSIFGTKNKFVPGFGQVIRPGGMSLDRAFEAAKEAGYFHDQADVEGTPSQLGIPDLLQAVEAETRGQKQYRLGHEPPAAKEDPAEREHFFNGQLDQALETAEIPPDSVTGALRDRVLQIMHKEGVTDPIVAWERAVMEQDEDAARSGQVEPRTEAIPGWDVPDERGATRGAGAAVAGEQPGAGEATRATGEGHPEPQPVNEYFQRVKRIRNLLAEREAEGQLSLPGAERISDAELVQRLADASLKASVDQKTPDFGLFGEKIQDELFQIARGKIRLAEGRRPIITLMRDANASTFIHESGHQWLEELLRDAQHPAAPDSLKDDATTVTDWLGVHSADEIKTKHHEKFARGFEQYLREGTAPSPALAGVFAKFRNWLLNIYQTIKGLGKPINEDIRGVFDRLLSEQPQRTVIAPEKATRPTLADIHEADAIHTEPQDAEPVMDMVIAERDRAIAEPPPGVSHERAAELAKAAEALGEGKPQGEGGGTAPEPPGQAGAGTGGLPEVVGAGGAAGALPAGGGVGAGDRAVEPGRGEARPEGPSLPGNERANRPGQSDREHPLAAQPADVIGPRESPFIDKAGNIRVENLTTSEDVGRAIHDAADANDNFIGDRRGVITDGQVMDLAADLGMDVQKLNTRKLGQAFNAEQIIAARQLLVSSATDVAAKMKRAATGTDQDVLDYAVAKDRHQMIQGQIAGITAEAGRALRAFRNIAGQEQAMGVDQFLRSATGKTLFQLRQEAKLGSALDTPQQVSKFMNDARKRTFGRMILEYWINGLISGPATHTTYMIGNTILALEKAGPETALAAGIGRVRSVLGRGGETVRMGEVAAQLRGGARGIAPALKSSIESFRTGVTTLLPGETSGQAALPFQPGTELATASRLDEAARFHDVAAAAFGLVRGLRDGMLAGGALLKAGGVEGSPLVGAKFSNLGSIPDITLRGVPVLPIGSAVRLPARFIAAIHSFFRSVNYSMAKGGDAYHVAANEGLHGEAFDARVAEIRANPTDEQMNNYTHGATELTLMGKGSPFVQALSRLTNTEIAGFPILKFVDPFVHIAGNIIDQSIVQRTPVGLLSAEIRADLMGRNGNVAQDMATARMLAGTGLSVLFGSLAAEGLVTGSGPEDRHKAAMWRLAGYQAHSVRVGDTWYQVNRLGPLGMLMGVAADMYDVAHHASQGELLTAAASLQHAFTQNVLDESFMRGPAQLIQALEDPGRYGEGYIRNFLSSFVPYSVGMAQMDRASDPYSRQARTVLDAIKAKVPGLSEQLFPRRDIWGEEMPNLEALVAKGVTSIYERQISTDPVNIAMLNLGVSPAALERKIRNVQLTDQQYDDYTRIAGRMTKMRLDAIVQSPDYQTWPNHVRHDVITEVVKQSRETARGIILMKNPEILAAATKAKLDKMHD